MISEKLDPITAATAFAAVLAGPELAELIGPYSVILLGSTTGAAWALGRTDPMPSRFAALLFFIRLNLMALLLTVPLAHATGSAFEFESSTWLLAPIALAIGAIGNDWPTVGKYLAVKLVKFFERKTGSKHGD